MPTRLVLLALLVASCATGTGGALPWEYRGTVRSGYARVAAEGVDALVARAEANFLASPAFAENGPMPLILVGVARRADGRTKLAFAIGGLSDTEAIYVFNSRGEIVDRYLHSYWG